MGPGFIEVNGAKIAYWEQPGAEPAIVLCHATSFHGRCWDRVTARIAGQRSIAMDLRGHGLSAKPAPPIPWRDFGMDVAALCRQLGLRGAIGVGHSMGGHSVTLAAALAPEAFSRLILLDPVIVPEAAYTGPVAEPHFARKRRNRWPSWQEMLERFRTRSPFDRWDEKVLRDYCEYGLLVAPDSDGFVLACSPEVEGAIYEYSRARESNIYPEIATIRIPVTILRSERTQLPGASMDMLASLTARDLAAKFADAEDQVVEYSHFIPMEAPAFVAEQIRARL